ncbi:MAG: flagellar motor protein [Deltaproteobacteria bacterium]|nr:flagellar motor protein [Deltaproteobacteria bacterium]
MDKATLIGLILGGLALLGGHYLEGGSTALIFQSTALVIVFGGTAGAVFLSFSGSQLRETLKSLRQIWRNPRDDKPEQVRLVVELAYRARREGLLALDRELRHLPDSFWRRTLSLIIDGFPAEQVREVMEVELARLEEAGTGPARVFEAAGGYAPTIGILGAVLGLIQVMQHLTDPAKLGAGVAVAFVATIYGVASANLLFLPIAHKLRARHREELLKKEMVLEGLVALAQGEHPRLIAERLQGFLQGSRARSGTILPSFARIRVLTSPGRPRTGSYA